MVTPKIILDDILQECVQRAYEDVRLGRAGENQDRQRVFAKLLAQLEIDGYAMRYLDAKGRLAWKATPRLRDLINDLWFDAQADAEEENA